MASQPGLQTIAIHILPNISQIKGNQAMKFGHLIEYNKRNSFLQILWGKWGRETSSRPLFILLGSLRWDESKWPVAYFRYNAITVKARFPLGDKWRHLAIIFRRYLTIVLKTSVIRFAYIESEFWSSFDIMPDSEEKDILFLQLVVLFKVRKKKRRKRKIWVRELFRKYASGIWMSEKTYFLEILKYN